VTLLNAHPKIGLKILMSGGTRCNVTHREVGAHDFHGGSRNVIARVLRAFTPEQTRAWFESLSVRLELEETGKYFPESDDAQTVLDALLGAAARAGVVTRSGARVVRLEPAGGRWRLGIQRVSRSAAFDSGAVAGRGEATWPLPETPVDEWLEADAVILATGGLSFPRTGSDGTGYALATALGHTLEPPVPALTPLTADDPLCREAQGVTCEAELSLWVDGRKRATTRGSFLITHFGYSGPAALDLSRHWHRAEGSDRRVTASFAPPGLRTAQSWAEAAQVPPRRNVRRLLATGVPEAIADALAREAGIEPTMLAAQVDTGRRAALIGLLTARRMPVTGTLGYEKAEVTAGGVRMNEVNPSTLESRKAPGVYLCGEILDVEGRLGGFNFQWAWSSGTVAGRGAGRPG
jgi:predicted flavoprotein YhiN